MFILKLYIYIKEKFKKVITVEDGCLMGGFGSAILEFMNENNYKAQIKRLGIPDEFIEHGTPKELYAECGFNADGIAKAVQEILSEKVKVRVN